MAKAVEFPCGYDLLDEFMLLIAREHPKVKVYYKNSSVLMKVIYYGTLMWIWQKTFFQFHTTIGSKIYLVDSSIKAKMWRSIYGTMRHEFVHVLQREKWWLLYDFSYILPQILALIAFGVAFGQVWMLGFMVFAGPIPSPWRMKWEMEGYTATLLTYFEIHGEIPDWLIKQKARNFYTSAYYFMWPFKKDVLRRLNRIATKIKAGYIKGVYINIYT